MTAPHARPSAHPSDGVLLALHDDERDETLRAELDAGRAHVEQCEECRLRVNAIAARSTRVRQALATIPIPSTSEDVFRRRVAASVDRPVPVWRRPAWLAAAAVIVLAGAAAASPIREWIRRHIGQSRIDVPPAALPVRPESAPTNRAGATVSFAPVGPAFTLRLDSLPAAGSLSATATTAATISARVATGAGTGGDEMVVLPGEIRVRNGSSARASYELSLPGVVTRLRVIVAGRTVFDGSPPVVLRLDRPR